MTSPPAHILLIFLIIASFFVCSCITSKEDYKPTENYTVVKWNGSNGILWTAPGNISCEVLVSSNGDEKTGGAFICAARAREP